MTREELELSTDIRDFTTLIYVILRHESSECRLELSIKSYLGMRFAICSLDLPFAILLSSNTVSSERTDREKEYLTCLLIIFEIRESEIFISVIRDPLFFPFVNRARPPPPPPPYNPLYPNTV